MSLAEQKDFPNRAATLYTNLLMYSSKSLVIFCCFGLFFFLDEVCL